MNNLQYTLPKKIVLIGASTGGPGQIQKIINSLPVLQNTTVIIAQHMVEGFIESFASRLQSNSSNSISVIRDAQALSRANIYVCEGVTELNVRSSGLTFSQKVSPKNSYNPDINRLFNSFIPLSKKVDILSVILTGIGDDGVESCRALSAHGSSCITESEQSAIVDGMPSRARVLVPNIEVHGIENIVQIISEFCE